MKDKDFFQAAPEWNAGGTARGFHGVAATVELNSTKLPRDTKEEATGKNPTARERQVGEA